MVRVNTEDGLEARVGVMSQEHPALEGLGILGRLRNYVRSRGPWGTLQRLLRLFVYSREHYVLVYKSMEAEIPRVAARVPGIIRLAVPGDLERLGAFSHHYTVDEFRRWIDRGRCLYVFEHEDRLIGYRLVTREVPRFGAAHEIVRLEPTDTWVVNAYTLPEYRGARIGSALASHVLAANRVAGFKREVSLIRIDNEASRKMVGLAGAREMEEIRYTRLLGFKKVRVRSTHARRYYGGPGDEHDHA